MKFSKKNDTRLSRDNDIKIYSRLNDSEASKQMCLKPSFSVDSVLFSPSPLSSLQSCVNVFFQAFRIKASSAKRNKKIYFWVYTNEKKSNQTLLSLVACLREFLKFFSKNHQAKPLTGIKKHKIFVLSLFLLVLHYLQMC